MDKQFYNKTEVDQMFNNSNEALDIMWVLIGSIMILMMQLGFALLEAGSVRYKNHVNILLKNLLDTFTGSIAFYLCGYGFANHVDGGIIGMGKFVGRGFENKDYINWIF